MSVPPGRDTGKGWHAPGGKREPSVLHPTAGPGRERLTDHERWDRVLAAFDRCELKPTGKPHQWSLNCPVHEDATHSAGLGEGRDGRVVFCCHSCHADCATAFGAVGLDFALAFPDRDGSPESGRASEGRKARPPDAPPPPTDPPPGRPERPPIDWPAVHEAALREERTAEAQRSLAAELRVSIASCAGLEISFKDEGRTRLWRWPMRDGAGKVIGMGRRYPDGSKTTEGGAKLGLVIPAGWHERPGPVFLVEGPSDVAALLTMGLCAVGRPNNWVNSTPGMLAELLAANHDRAVVVLAENDFDPERPKRGRPGEDGARKTASALAGLLGRAVAWTLPPAGAKDVRAWWLAQGIDPEDAAAAALAGQRFVEEVSTSPTMCYPSGGQRAQSSCSSKAPPEDPPHPPNQEDCARTTSQGGDSSSNEERKNSYSDDLRAWLGLGLPPPAVKCYRLQGSLAKHRRNPANFRALFLCCHAWTCHICCRRRAFVWAIHLAGKFAALPCDQGESAPLHALALAGLCWAKVRTRLSRGKADYARIGEDGLLITTTPLDGAEPVSVGAAIRRLGAAVGSLVPPVREAGRKHLHPITTSRAWRLPPREKVRDGDGNGEEASLWERLKELRTRDPEAVVAVLKAHGVPHAVTLGTDPADKLAARITWVCPSAWPPERCKALADEVGNLEPPDEEAEPPW